MNDGTESRRKEDLLPSVVEAIPRIDEVLSIVDHPGMTLDWMAVKDHIRGLTERLAEQEEVLEMVAKLAVTWMEAGQNGQAGGYLLCAFNLLNIMERRKGKAPRLPDARPAKIHKKAKAS